MLSPIGWETQPLRETFIHHSQLCKLGEKDDPNL